MSIDIKETAVSAIQRDRLTEFIKSSYEGNEGACFYYSLIGAYNQLYPGKATPRDLEQHIFKTVKKNCNFSVNSENFIQEISNLEPLLHIKLSEIHLYEDVSELEYHGIKLNVPKNILVKRITGDDSFKKLGKESTVILLLSKESEGHMVHIYKNFMSLTEDDGINYYGGHPDFELFLKKGLALRAALFLTKTK